MNKRFYSVVGATLLFTSAVAILDYAVRKKKSKKPCSGELVAGIAGLLFSAVISLEPTKEAKRKIVVGDMMTDDDAALVDENISEVLGNTADRGNHPAALRKIEVDEETSIEDFI